jgi:hypothetical protein
LRYVVADARTTGDFPDFFSCEFAEVFRSHISLVHRKESEGIREIGGRSAGVRIELENAVIFGWFRWLDFWWRGRWGVLCRLGRAHGKKGVTSV